MLLAWFVFPVVLALLSVGCGLLVAEAAGLALPLALVPPLGLALIIAVADLVTMWGATAQLASPLAIALAIAGYGLGGRRLQRARIWAPVCAVATFAVYAAPIVLSGQATFAGYVTLDDTATWLAVTDRVMSHGRTLAGLAPSTYQALLADVFTAGYPLGSFMPLGLGGKLTGVDIAWLFQPTLAFYAAMLSLAIYAASARLVASRALRALVGFLGAQATLLFAYSLWSGIKELATAGLVALLAASIAETIDRWQSLRATLPSALAVAALFAVLSPAGLVWLAVPTIVVLVILVPLGLFQSVRIATALVGLIALLSIPSIAIARTFINGSTGEITSSTDVSHLGHPLDSLQVFGIWPATDFRDRPHDETLTYALIAILVAGLVAGLVLARHRRALGVPLYLATGVGGFLLLLGFEHIGLSSPWLNAKAMAEASPALVAAGVAGAAALFETGRRVEGAVIGCAIAAGVLWSNALAYSGAWLAPRTALAELQTIGHRFAGQGPALMTDTEAYYGVRHFLRSLDPEGASDLRTRLIPLLDGRGLGRAQYADLDQFQLGGILVYKTIVLSRSPAESRPPSVYRLVWSGRYYDVWQRPDVYQRILQHVPLGNSVQPGGVPACSEVHRLATVAGLSGRLVAPPRAPNVVVDFAGVPLPAGWTSDASGHLYPTNGGAVTKDFTVPTSGRYGLWIGGSFRDSLRIYVDGRLVAHARNRLTKLGYWSLGSAVLSAGAHRLVLRYGGSGLLPGSGGNQFGLGPFVLSRGIENVPVVSVPSSRARALCGRNLDWIEALGS